MIPERDLASTSGIGGMIVRAAYRWLRAAARGAVALLTVFPAVALAIAILVDRGPDGEPRVSLFPVALLALDPFAWTCARNSLIFATAVTVLALIGGVFLASVLSARRFPGRGAFHAAAASMLAATPACLALGFLGFLETSRSWPWPAWMREAASGSLSLESWRGLPSWALWIWAGLPTAIALVTLATAAALERVDPAWRDAARQAGAGTTRTFLTVHWPLIRPAAARAAAIVFPMALVEPGGPSILGLRRTLAFQIVETATRPDPFPRVAVWAAMAAVLSVAGRWLLRWWGGPPLLDVAHNVRDGHRSRPPAPRAGMPLAVACAAVVAGSVGLGWLPVVGLGRLLWAVGPRESALNDSPSVPFGTSIPHPFDPPVPQVLAQTMLLSIEVGAGVLVLAWLLRPDPGVRHASTATARFVGRFALMPPLIQSAGVLAIPGLLDAAAFWLMSFSGLRTPAARVAGVARELAVERNPWAILVAAVGLSVGARLLQNWRRTAERRPDETRPGLDAAILAGASPVRARAVAALRPGGWFGCFLLAFILAAINVAPALLFSPWMDGRPIAPAMLGLAKGPDPARVQAALLAFGVIAGNIAGLLTARLASAPPPEWDPDPP
jgi:ABC-type Fe3+ transport system permease subunit